MIKIKALGKEFRAKLIKEIEGLGAYEIKNNWTDSEGKLLGRKLEGVLKKIDNFTLKNSPLNFISTENEQEPNPLLIRLKMVFYTPEITLSFDENREIKYRYINQEYNRYKKDFLEITEKDGEKLLSMFLEEIKDINWKEMEEEIKKESRLKLKEALKETRRELESNLNAFIKSTETLMNGIF